MPKILFIALHRPNRNPSQRFRFEQYFDYLTKQGYSCELSFLLSEKDDKIFYAKGNYIGKFLILLKSIFIRFKDVFRARSYDILFIHREAFMLGTTFFERLLRKTNVPMVFDFDDAIWIDQHSEFSANNALRWMKDPLKTAVIIQLCDLVFAGNAYLNAYAEKYNKNTVIIPTTVNTDEFIPTPTKIETSPICIGWSGSHTTIEHFTHVIPVLKKIKSIYGNKVSFKVIGDPNYKNDALEIKGIPWNAQTEVAELNTLDIGIMPLPDQEWTKGKCGLKGLSYMSLSIPTIMSPVGVNNDIIQDGVNGFLASTEEEWIQKLSMLIENPQLRKQLGEKGRNTVENYYSVNAQKSNYLSQLNQLLASRTRNRQSLR